MTDASARSQGIMTLGELRAALKMLPSETPVVMAGGVAPSALSSYRGYYERLSIETKRHRDDYATEIRRCAAHPVYDPDPAVAEVTIAEPVTAAEMVKALDLADGEEFEGYKGGHFAMDGGTWMHVAEYGDTGQAVYGVTLRDGKAIIQAADYDW